MGLIGVGFGLGKHVGSKVARLLERPTPVTRDLVDEEEMRYRVAVIVAPQGQLSISAGHAMNGKFEIYASQNDAVSRLVTIAGIGALGPTAIAAAAGDGQQFRTALDLANWLGLVPAEHSPRSQQALHSSWP